MAAFYLCVFPLGIIALFAIIQCSPNPAHSIEETVECLLVLSVICLVVTLPVSLLVMQKCLRRSLTCGSGMWCLLGVVASIYLLCALFGYHGSFPFSPLGLEVLELCAGFSFTHYELTVGIGLALMTILGIAQRMGPIIPSVFFGMFAIRLILVSFGPASCVAYEVGVAQRRAIEGDILVLIFGAVCGLILGLFLEGKRIPGQKDAENNYEKAS
ncbi:MAG: hypothetical protein JXM70_23000 [Pirellulales bacterium]|nr:hypothetical protein [Pirellulales bacterium]